MIRNAETLLGAGGLALSLLHLRHWHRTVTQAEIDTGVNS